MLLNFQLTFSTASPELPATCAAGFPRILDAKALDDEVDTSNLDAVHAQAHRPLSILRHEPQRSTIPRSTQTNYAER